MGRSLPIAASIAIAIAPTIAAAELQWFRQFGSSEADYPRSVSADNLGNVYVSGDTYGNIADREFGINDAFVSKFDASGGRQWTRVIGTYSVDESYGVAADSLGHVYAVGITGGNLFGPPTAGYRAFVVKYDDSGNELWKRQFGSSLFDVARGVSVDGVGNIYVTGYAGQGQLEFDAVIRKLDPAGGLIWEKKLGTYTEDVSWGVSATRSGDAYITGYTRGSFDGPKIGYGSDAFVAKYDASGNFQWVRQFGGFDNDQGLGVSADELGNVFVGGRTFDDRINSSSGSDDAFVRKYDASGNLQWATQLGTTGADIGASVAADQMGNAYLSGGTAGNLGGASAGSVDAFIAKCDGSGAIEWIKQFGGHTADFGFGISANQMGQLYVTGFINGGPGAPASGNPGGLGAAMSADAFIARFSDKVPEPTAAAVALVGALAIVRRRKQLRTPNLPAPPVATRARFWR